MEGDRTPLLDEANSQNEPVGTEIDLNNTNHSDCDYIWQVVGACFNSLVQFLIGGTVFVTLWFAFKSTPISVFQLHIGLCVIGVSFILFFYFIPC